MSASTPRRLRRSPPRSRLSRDHVTAGARTPPARWRLEQQTVACATRRDERHPHEVAQLRKQSPQRDHRLRFRRDRKRRRREKTIGAGDSQFLWRWRQVLDAGRRRHRQHVASSSGRRQVFNYLQSDALHCSFSILRLLST